MQTLGGSTHVLVLRLRRMLPHGNTDATLESYVAVYRATRLANSWTNPQNRPANRLYTYDRLRASHIHVPMAMPDRYHWLPPKKKQLMQCGGVRLNHLHPGPPSLHTSISPIVLPTSLQTDKAIGPDIVKDQPHKIGVRKKPIQINNQSSQLMKCQYSTEN